MIIRADHKINNQQGNIVIITAVSLTVFLGILALVADGGYLMMRKNKYQNSVEAAALAAAMNICDSSYDDVARLVASENQIPYDSEKLTVRIGFYDLDDTYDDFTGYKDFIADSDTDTVYNEALSDPSNDQYVYNNAVMVSLKTEVPAFFSGILAQESATVSASAVSVASNAGLFSYDDDPVTGGIIIDNLYSCYINFNNTGIIHSNTEIEFSSTGSTAITGGTRATAAGDISHCPVEDACSSGEEELYPSQDLDDIMAELKDEAGGQNRIIPMTDASFPSYTESSMEGGRYDDDGNFYYSYYYLGADNYIFCPHDGNHSGAVYYFEGANPHNGRLGISGPPRVGSASTHAKNFVIAAEEDLAFNGCARGELYLGGHVEDMVSIYTTGNVGGPIARPRYYGSIGEHRFYGVFFRVGGYFGIRINGGDTEPAESDKFRINIRVNAQGKIKLADSNLTPTGPWYVKSDFGPPCSPVKVILGKLE